MSITPGGHAVRTTDALQAMDPGTAFIEGGMQLLRRQNFLRDAFGQPEIQSEEPRDADEQDSRTEYRAHARNGNRHEKYNGQESGEDEQTVLTDDVADLGEGHTFGRKAVGDRFDFFAERFLSKQFRRHMDVLFVRWQVFVHSGKFSRFHRRQNAASPNRPVATAQTPSLSQDVSLC